MLSIVKNTRQVPSDNNFSGKQPTSYKILSKKETMNIKENDMYRNRNLLNDFLFTNV
jgi:hypothetical protein